MFIFTKDQKIVPHLSNIISIYKNTPILPQLESYKPIYAGGWPTALLFAPRDRLHISQAYYTDFDIYFEDNDNLVACEAHIEQTIANQFPIIEKVDTDNATTYVFQLPDHSGFLNNTLWLQLVKCIHGNPEQILDTYDFINSAVAFVPSAFAEGGICFHKEAPSYHVKGHLEIHNPWMLSTEKIDSTNIVIQLMRFKKYCVRWNYTLGEKALNKLLDVYKDNPELKIEKDTLYAVAGSGGRYTGFQYIGLANQNIWEAIAPIIRASSYWNDSLDIHGKIKEASDEVFLDPNINVQPEPTADNYSAVIYDGQVVYEARTDVFPAITYNTHYNVQYT